MSETDFKPSVETRLNVLEERQAKFGYMLINETGRFDRTLDFARHDFKTLKSLLLAMTIWNLGLLLALLWSVK